MHFSTGIYVDMQNTHERRGAGKGLRWNMEQMDRPQWEILHDYRTVPFVVL